MGSSEGMTHTFCLRIFPLAPLPFSLHAPLSALPSVRLFPLALRCLLSLSVVISVSLLQPPLHTLSLTLLSLTPYISLSHALLCS